MYVFEGVGVPVRAVSRDKRRTSQFVCVVHLNYRGGGGMEGSGHIAGCTFVDVYPDLLLIRKRI